MKFEFRWQLSSKGARHHSCYLKASPSSLLNLAPSPYKLYTPILKAMSEASARVVPGAPPPAPSIKSQRKKRKAKGGQSVADSVSIPDIKTAALVERAPQVPDIEGGNVAPELVARPKAPASIDDASPKASPITEHVAKKLKVTSKKIVRQLGFTNTICSCLLEIDAYLVVFVVGPKHIERGPARDAQNSSCTRSRSKRID